MQTIYINGVKATKRDLDALFDRVRKGIDYIVEVHTTKRNNIAITTA